MNNKVNIKKSNKKLLVLSIFVLMLSIVFKILYSYLGFSISICNIFFIINIFLLLITVVYNILLLFKYDTFNKYLKFIKLYIIFYIILNTVITIICNIPYLINISHVEEKIVSNCESFNCETFDYNKNVFTLTKQYLDYSKNSNYINIKNYYNQVGVYKIKAEIYSDKNLFSEYLIYEQVKDWFIMYYDIEPDFYYIGEAFKRRETKEKLEKNKYSYYVEEVYENDELIKMKTIIILNIDEEKLKKLK